MKVSGLVQEGKRKKNLRNNDLDQRCTLHNFFAIAGRFTFIFMNYGRQ